MIGKRWAAGCLVLLSTLSVSKATEGEQARTDDERLQRVVDDYVGLYRQESLPRWRELFLPTFTAALTTADGSVSVRTLEEFYGAQKRYLDTGRAIREELENVRIERQQRLASVWADFVLTDEGSQSRGKLVLLLIEDRGQFQDPFSDLLLPRMTRSGS
jgi:hypothetical protein